DFYVLNPAPVSYWSIPFPLLTSSAGSSSTSHTLILDRRLSFRSRLRGRRWGHGGRPPASLAGGPPVGDLLGNIRGSASPSRRDPSPIAVCAAHSGKARHRTASRNR